MRPLAWLITLVNLWFEKWLVCFPLAAKYGMWQHQSCLRVVTSSRYFITLLKQNKNCFKHCTVVSHLWVECFIGYKVWHIMVCCIWSSLCVKWWGSFFSYQDTAGRAYGHIFVKKDTFFEGGSGWGVYCKDSNARNSQSSRCYGNVKVFFMICGWHLLGRVVQTLYSCHPRRLDDGTSVFMLECAICQLWAWQPFLLSREG